MSKQQQVVHIKVNKTLLLLYNALITFVICKASKNI